MMHYYACVKWPCLFMPFLLTLSLPLQPILRNGEGGEDGLFLYFGVLICEHFI